MSDQEYGEVGEADHDEVEPVPGVAQVGELGEGEPAAHHLGRRLEGVYCCEQHPGTSVTFLVLCKILTQLTRSVPLEGGSS